MAPRYPEFPKEEFEQRHTRARKLMEEANIDALLITEELNYIYFTGHRSEQNPIDKIRPYIYILPKEDDGVLITMAWEMDQVSKTIWRTAVGDIRPAGLTGFVDLVASILKEKGLGNARIGAELGHSQRLGITFNEFMSLRNAVPEADFVDASSVLLRLRAIKSPREIEYMRKSAGIVAQAQLDTFEMVKSGMTEFEVMRIFRVRLAELGAENVTFMWVVSSGTGMVAPPTDYKLQPGDTVTLDAGVQYHGYASDISRSASVGEPSDEVTEFYDWLMRLRRSCIDMLRAGTKAGDVVKVCLEIVEPRGLELTGVGRIGHGVGLESTEFPSVTREADFVFETGMVFTMNPNFQRDFGWLNSEDEWLITDGNPELISSPIAPNKLPVIRVT